MNLGSLLQLTIRNCFTYMKNGKNLESMKEQINLKIHLKTYSNSRGKPNCRIAFNNTELVNAQAIVDPELVYDFNLTLTPINLLHITHYGKSTNATEVVDGKIISDVAVEVKDIWINGIAINDNFLYTQPFFSNWSGVSFPLTHNRYLGFNGTWQMAFPEDYKNFFVDHYFSEYFH